MVRDSLFDNLPSFFRSRFSAFRRFDWNAYFKKNWLVVSVSVLAGAASHILWDGFTHGHGCFVGMMPALANRVDILGVNMPVFKILQHASTAVGGGVVGIVMCMLPTDGKAVGKVSVTYWAVAAGVAVWIVAVRFLCGLDIRQYGNVAVTCISASLISLALTPQLIKQR
jgi:hypothetical protein